MFSEVWGGGGEGEAEARGLIARVEGLVRGRGGDEGDREGLERESLREITAVVEFCRKTFGEGEVRDARGAWVKPGEDHRKMGEEMVSGGKGFRKF